MNDAGRWIKNRAMALGMNQAALARRIRVEAQTIRNYWKKGLSEKTSGAILEALAEQLHVNREGLERLQQGKAPLPRQYPPAEEVLSSPPGSIRRSNDAANIPIYSSVAAGDWDEGLNLYESFDSAHVSDEYLDRRLVGVDDPDAFAFRIRGRCMFPLLKDGDLVVASPKASGTDGAKIKSGNVCLIRFTPESSFKGSQTVKRVFDNGDGTIRLQPENVGEGFMPIIVKRKHIAAMFRLVKSVGDL